MIPSKKTNWDEWLTPSERAQLEEIDAAREKIIEERARLARRRSRLQSRATARRAMGKMPEHGRFAHRAADEALTA